MLQFFRNKSNFFYLFILILACLPVLIPLLSPGFFETDDGSWMIIRFSAFHQALRDGQFPVRWLGRLNFEYGYPVADFLYPGFLYFGEAFKLFGFSFVNSIKAVLILSTLGSGVFIYLWLSKVFNKLAGFVGALLYIYAPYHLFDIYKRGSVGENLALGLLPLCLLFLEYEMFFLFTLSVSFLLISHNTLAILFFPIILGCVFIKLKKDPIRLVRYVVALLLSICMSLFFWGPALYDLQFTIFSQTSVSDWSNYFANYNLVGFASFVVLFVAIYLLASKTVKQANKPSLVFYFLALLIISIFFSTSISFFVWEFLPVSFVQFPFRFLSIVVISISFLGAFVCYSLRHSLQKAFLAIVVILSIPAFSFVKAQTLSHADSFYSTNEATTTVRNEYMPKWVKILPSQRPLQKVQVVRGNGIVEVITASSKKILLKTYGLTPTEEMRIRVNTIYFPGWNAYVDGKKSAIEYENKSGVMEVLVRGNHKIEFIFSETPFRLASDVISLIGFGILILLSVTMNRQKKRV